MEKRGKRKKRETEKEAKKEKKQNEKESQKKKIHKKPGSENPLEGSQNRLGAV